jgi:hypothetical protein
MLQRLNDVGFLVITSKQMVVATDSRMFRCFLRVIEPISPIQ